VTEPQNITVLRECDISGPGFQNPGSSRPGRRPHDVSAAVSPAFRNHAPALTSPAGGHPLPAAGRAYVVDPGYAAD